MFMVCFLLINCYLAPVLGLLTSASLALEGSEDGRKKNESVETAEVT